MAIEQAAQVDDKEHPLNSQTNQSENSIDWQGLTPAQNMDKQKMSRDVGNEKPERGIDVERSPKPDARDEEKVERLAAPDWRSEQPMPSARNALDPRGENTPEDFYETDPAAHDAAQDETRK